jgi:hypothetical protein
MSAPVEVIAPVDSHHRPLHPSSGCRLRCVLRFGLRDFGLTFSEDEFEGLWRFLDRDSSGSIDYNEVSRRVVPATCCNP